ncbi:host specificity J domain protein [Escherichia coli 2866750]|nr:host specificity J domain protein [Escherichia coli 2866750]
MAWCLWDMLTHPRYGMGKRLGARCGKWACMYRPDATVVPDGLAARSRASPVMRT